MNKFIEDALTFLYKNSNNGGSLTPNQKEYVDIIKSGDSSKGEQLATNLCKSMGMSKEQAIAQAREFFHI